jgi:hypothetical protein
MSGPRDQEGAASKKAELPVADRYQIFWRNATIAVVLGIAIFSAVISLYYFIIDGVIIDLGYKHFITIFGRPAAAAAALAIVMVTRAISGQMSVEFFGLKFHGAASEAIMWVVCFLAITYAVKSTWLLQYIPEPPWISLGGRR